MILSLLYQSLFAGAALAAPGAVTSSRVACSGNTPTTRSKWCNLSVDTDYWTQPVDTGVTKEYWLDLTDVEVAPDGVRRSAMAINGTIPGPTLFADWGDTVKVHVTNSLKKSKNGTSIHWHGVRQNFTNEADGVSSVTQCPSPVGETTTYTWKATQYGSTWYHSHFALQAYQGIFGGIIVNGPASANYDEDLGMVFLNDWDHQTVDQLSERASREGPPTFANGLINGTNVFGADGSSAQTGKRLTVPFKAGKTYRMRLVNAAINSHWKFTIDNHTITVIAADLVPVKPYKTNVVDLSIGQRIDILVTADQGNVAENFWMRSIPQSACTTNDNAQNIRGIVHYGKSPSTPNTTGHKFTDSCMDETPNLVPSVPKTVKAADWKDLELTTVEQKQNTAGNFNWFLNSTTLVTDWADPTLGQVMRGATTWSKSNAVVQLPEANKWVYLVVQTALPVPHPIHLHGHDFFVLAQGIGTYSSTTNLKTDNPPTDNPGAWLMHCHIGWHASEGFALQFVERYNEIAGITNGVSLNKTCNSWKTFQSKHAIKQADSGI
ncbi:laccase-1 [Phaeosphaeriaceae sp. PMI808]|nr:laccase-1 [Phaeosphaeriaceae sp. PMI808]